MIAPEYLVALLVSLMAYFLGVGIGTYRQIKKHEPERYRARSYHQAVADLDKWCGRESSEVRLIAQHLKAIGEGRPLNCGTPVSEEPCTVAGLREQLRRLRTKSCD